MPSNPAGPIRKAWYRWKALRLPWRKRFLVGLDLSGNTFWEFRDQLSSTPNRMRRIVKYPSSTQLSEVTGKISPSWHQWLRYTRKDPPSLTEQSQDLVRQRNLKILAAAADARWAAKPSFLDAPGTARRQSLPAVGKNEHSVVPNVTGESRSNGEFQGEFTLEIKPSDLIEETESPLLQQKETPVLDEQGHTFGDRSEGTGKLKEKKYKEDPWKRSRGGPSEEWQPQAWDPSGGSTK